MYLVKYDVVNRDRHSGETTYIRTVEKYVNTVDELNYEFFLYLSCYENDNWQGDYDE